MSTPPPKDEGVSARDADPSQNTQKPNEESVAAEPCDRKTLATLTANLALHHGVSLFELSDGTFLATKWNLTRPLRDLHAVSAFVRQLGGTA